MEKSIIEVVAALLEKEGKFLICRRPPHKARGLLWEFVGGKVEKGETKEEALIRECREELGIDISVKELFTEVLHEYPDITIHLSVFKGHIENGQPKLFEHTELRYISPDEITDYDFCPADKEILEKIEREWK